MNLSRNIEKTSNQQQPQQTERRWVTPPVDIYENADELLLIADLPGVEATDVKIRLEKGELLLEARRNAVAEAGRQLSQGWKAFDYGRRFLVPGGIDPGKIEAQLKNGVLFLHLPKAESAKPREIPVRAR